MENNNVEKSTRWLFSKEEIMNSPSRKDNVSFDREMKYRQMASSFIQDLGESLKVNQLCINTAIVYMHRFFMLQSLAKFDRYKVGLACLFLSAKSEEMPQRIDTVINKAYRLLYKREGGYSPSAERYNKMEDDITFHETVILMTLGFEICVSHPHPIIIKSCGLIKANKELQTTSYFLASNSLHLTTMCLEYRPSIVASLCIYFASKWIGYEIPLSADGKPWYSYIDSEVTLDFLDHLTNDFLSIFEHCRTKLRKAFDHLSTAKQRVPSNKLAIDHNNNTRKLTNETKQTERKTEKGRNENEVEPTLPESFLSKPNSVLTPTSLFSKEELAKLQEPIKSKEKQLPEAAESSHSNNSEKDQSPLDLTNSKNNSLKRKRSIEEDTPRKRVCVSNETDQELPMRIDISTILKASLSNNTLKSFGISDPASIPTFEFAPNLPQMNIVNGKAKSEPLLNHQTSGFQFPKHQSIKVDFAKDFFNRRSEVFQFSNFQPNAVDFSSQQSNNVQIPHFQSTEAQLPNLQSNHVKFSNLQSKDAQFSNHELKNAQFSNFSSKDAQFSKFELNGTKFSNLQSSGAENSNFQSSGYQFSSDQANKVKFSKNDDKVRNLVQVPLNNRETLIASTVDTENESDIYVNVTDISDSADETQQIVPNIVCDDNNNNQENEKKRKSKNSTKERKEKAEKAERKERLDKKEKREVPVQEDEKNCDIKVRKPMTANNRPESIKVSIPKEKLNLSDNILFGGNKVNSEPKPSLKIKIPKKFILDSNLTSPSTSEPVQTSLNLPVDHDIHKKNKNEETWMTQHRMQPVFNGY